MEAESSIKQGTAGGTTKPEIFLSGGSKGGQTFTASSRKPRKQEGSIALPLYGRREVKQFPITENELKNLGQLRNSATIFSSVGTALIGIGIGILKDIVITDKPKHFVMPLIANIQIPQPPQDFDWKPISIAFVIAGFVSFLFGMYQIWVGRGLVKKIEDETKFDD